MPDMPSLQQMHQLTAVPPRAQTKLLLLMDDIADSYFMSIEQSFRSRHLVQRSLHHRYCIEVMH